MVLCSPVVASTRAASHCSNDGHRPTLSIVWSPDSAATTYRILNITNSDSPDRWWHSGEELFHCATFEPPACRLTRRRLVAQTRVTSPCKHLTGPTLRISLMINPC